MIDLSCYKNTALTTPRLEIYPERVAHNTRSIVKLCHEKGVQVACVTKVFSAHNRVVDAMVQGGADMLADSRTENLWELRKQGHTGPFMLLRIPEPSKACDVVTVADVSLNSSLETLKALSWATVLLHRVHRVIIMVDVGDLREGIWPDKAIELIKAVKVLPGILPVGLGCNLACFGGVMPSEENMALLIRIRDLCQAEANIELPLLSGGNSSGLPLLLSGKLPRQINHFRVGEAIVLGRNVIDRSPLPGTRQDTFICVGEVIEVGIKPSVPVGERGQDAFGGTPDFVERGMRMRAICNLGRQDVVIDGLTPVDPGIQILGGSSDHLILDVENAKGLIQPGAELSFYPGYGALLALSTSKYVNKFVFREKA